MASKLPRVRRRYDVDVTQHHIDSALLKDSSRCMIADAVGDALAAMGIKTSGRSADTRTIRFTLPDKGIRAICLTPAVCGENLLRWDAGIKPEPWSFRLEVVQFTKSGCTSRKTNKDVPGLPKGQTSTVVVPGRRAGTGPDDPGPEGSKPVILGGRAPAIGALSNNKKTTGNRREFGLRGLTARLLDEIQAAASRVWTPDSGLGRCESVKRKEQHAGESDRAKKGSSWRCHLVAGHDGMHEAKPSARQSPW